MRRPRANQRSTADAQWWREAVFYQIYVRSFADSDGDGVGDLEGIRSRLGYLELLGVDALWLTPFYRSPMADHGYDVTDPRDVDPVYGELHDFDALVTDAHAHGIKVTIDLVPNHTSNTHAWFKSAVAAGAGSLERERYVFGDGRGPGGEEPPNNWLNSTGAPAWTRVPDGQWYLHLFASRQPDLNWANHEVRADFEHTLRFWLDRGVDGFRIDVAHGLAKAPGLPDMDLGAVEGTVADPRFDNDDVHEIHEMIRKVLDDYPSTMAAGEIRVADDERHARYLRPGELHLTFNFRLVAAHFDADAIRTAIVRSLTVPLTTGTPATWTLADHGVPRPVTRYGGGERGVHRARAMALVELALPGAAYLYNGEELGLGDAGVPEALHGAGHGSSHLPIPWEGDEPPFAFSRTPHTWLPMPLEWAAVTVAAQLEDAGSTLSLYRHALEIRHENPAFQGDDLEWYGAPAGCFAFRRVTGGLICVLNTSASPIALPPGEVLLSSSPMVDGKLPPDSAAWLG